MKDRFFYIYMLLALLLLYATSLSATSIPEMLQSTKVNDAQERRGYTMDEIRLRTPWTLSDNTAGLVHYNMLDFFTVGASYNSESGDHRNYNTPESAWNAGTHAQAYKRVNRTYFYGDFRYENDTKSNQSWLGTVLPDFTSNPILDSIPGRVLQESYIMTGKVAYRLSDRIALGGGIDYRTSTMAKRKDGRNSNVFSALDVKPGICFNFGNFNAGANLMYQYWVDGVNYEYIGDESGKSIYYMEGLFFTTSSGITNTTTMNRKYFMKSYGGAIQLDYQRDRVEAFNQFKWVLGDLNNFEGTSLLKRYSTEDLFDFDYKGYFKIIGGRTNHFVQLGFQVNERASYAIINKYEEVPDEIQSWQYAEKDKTLRYLDLQKQADASYRFCYKNSDWRYNFTAVAGYNRWWSDKIFKVHPDSYGQDFSVNTFYLQATKFFYSGTRHTIELNGQLALSKGSPAENMLEATGTGHLGQLILNRTLLSQDFNYYNESRKTFGIGGRYRYVLNPEKGNSIDFLVKYRRVNNNDGLFRSCLSLGTSYNF